MVGDYSYGNWALEREQALLQDQLNKNHKKSERELKPIFLPEDPKENWTCRGKELKPIYLPGQKK